MPPPKPPAPDITPCIAKAAAALEAAIDANSPRNACAWLELLTKLAEASR